MQLLAMSNFSLRLLLSLSFTTIVLVQSLTLPSDIKALQAFKSSIKPSSITPYSCLATWNFSTDPCTRPRRTYFTCGLTCTDDSTRVTSLVLDPVGYSGALSPLISQLTQLTILDLSDNSFFGPIPSSLSSLSLLQTLTLRSNSFSGSLPPSITTLKSLQTLDFSRNLITGSLPKSMNSLSNLRRLDLSFNQLTGSLPQLPSNLIELALKSNSLSGSLDKSFFTGLTQLEVVELSVNSFSGTIQGWFFLLPSIQQVNLANNSFTGVEIWKPNGGMSDLVALDLSFNRIEGRLPVNFSDYPVLASLSIRYNRLRGPIPWDYSKKQSLRRLFIDGNFLSGKPSASFFTAATSVTGSFGDNCLQSCPVSSQLCVPAQKPTSLCRPVYGGKPRS